MKTITIVGGKPLTRCAVTIEGGLTTDARTIMDGVLLSDGCIAQPKRVGRSPRFTLTQSQRRAGWVRAVAHRLAKNGIATNLYWSHARPSRINGRQVKGRRRLTLDTRNYFELRQERERWYPNGHKKVPHDLKLTPEIVADWFAGDGTYDRLGSLMFCTDGFSLTDVNFLVQRLQHDLEISAYVLRVSGTSNVRIQLRGKGEALKLRDLITPFVPPCCRYKFRWVRACYRHGPAHRRLRPSQIRSIRAQRNVVPQRTLARRFSVDQMMISKIQRGKAYKDVD
jgi:hypothetical protein